MFEIVLPRTQRLSYSYVTGENELLTEYIDWRLVAVYKEWCKEKVGADNWNYYGAEKKTPCVLRFKNEEDLLAFKLTFGL